MNDLCPLCDKVSSTALDLARHIIDRGDKVHSNWIRPRGFKYSDLLATRLRSFGGERYQALAEVLERDAKVESG